MNDLKRKIEEDAVGVKVVEIEVDKKDDEITCLMLDARLQEAIRINHDKIHKRESVKEALLRCKDDLLAEAK